MISLSARLCGAKYAALALTLGAFSPALLAQEKLVREIDFVRGLAKDMKFIELAQAEADRLASEYRGAGDQDQIAQLSVEVAYYGARSRNDRNQQRALFKKSLSGSGGSVCRLRAGPDRTNGRVCRLRAATLLLLSWPIC